MTLFRSILSVAGLLALAVTANAQTVPDNIGTSSAGLPTALRNVGFEPPLNGQIPLSLAFRDEFGRDVPLGDYFGHKPVLLALVYYGCPMLCNQVEQGVVVPRPGTEVRLAVQVFVAVGGIAGPVA